MKKEPTNKDLLKIFNGFERQYGFIGDCLEVKVADIRYDAAAPKDGLREVFNNWRKKDEDVTWKRIIEMCNDFPDDFGRVKFHLEEYLSSKKACEKI